MPEKPHTPSSRTSVRLSLQYSFVYATLSAIVFVMTYFYTQYEIREWVRIEMRGAAMTLEAIYRSEGIDALISGVDTLAKASFENAHIYQLLDEDGSIISGNIPAKMDGRLPDRILAEDIHLLGGVNEELVGYWMRGDQIGPYRLVQGSSDHVFAEILEALGYALLAGSLVVVVLGLIVGVRVGRLTEQRISGISRTLSDFSGGKLDVRIPAPPGKRDDLGRVSTSINLMLDKIERLLESQEQISNDIAHDMRTPLQHLRQRLEAMQSSPKVSHEDVTTSLEHTEEIIGTFNALLRIAQIEGADRRARFERFDIRSVIENVAEFFEPLADDEGMTLDAQSPGEAAVVLGDRGLLTQLLSNLVENAIKHSPAGIDIKISVHTTPTEVSVRVADGGPGVEPADHERIFRRFFRGEKSRNSYGNGLGLSLVKAIADLHGATLSVSNNNPGAVFEVRFPNERSSQG